MNRILLWTVGLALVLSAIGQQVRASRSGHAEIGLTFSQESSSTLRVGERPEAVIQPAATKRVAPDFEEAVVEELRREPESRRGTADIAAAVPAVPETAAPSRGRAPPATR